MTLAEWMEAQAHTCASFGEAIGAAAESVRRYRAGERIPRPAVMARIQQATQGAVTAADFYPPPSSTPDLEKAA